MWAWQLQVRRAADPAGREGPKKGRSYGQPKGTGNAVLWDHRGLSQSFELCTYALETLGHMYPPSFDSSFRPLCFYGLQQHLLLLTGRKRTFLLMKKGEHSAPHGFCSSCDRVGAPPRGSERHCSPHGNWVLRKSTRPSFAVWELSEIFPYQLTVSASLLWAISAPKRFHRKAGLSESGRNP